MKKERITKEEIDAKLRQEGIGVDGVVLETDGTLSVISQLKGISGEYPVCPTYQCKLEAYVLAI